MPKKSGKSSWGGRGRGGGSSGGSGGRNKSSATNYEDKHFFGHDDRTRDIPSKSTKHNGDRKPRVSFKNAPMKKGSRNRDRDRWPNLDILKRVLDEDIPMSSDALLNNNEARPRCPRTIPCRHHTSTSQKGGVGNSRNHQSKKNLLGNTVWHAGTKLVHIYKITIPLGHKCSKQYLIETLRAAIAPDTFVPILYRVAVNTGAVFYVDQKKTVEKLTSCSMNITTPEGSKLEIRVESSSPQSNIDDDLKARMKQAMAKRYNQETNSLDLRDFHHDPDLVDEFYCPLTRPGIFLAVLDIVTAVTPNLEALNLESNNLHSFDKINILTKKLPALKTLYLGDNHVRDIQQLNALKDLKLKDLRLTGNPFCEKFKGREEKYVRIVRQKFPELVRLDNVDLPVAIRFDLSNDRLVLPPSQILFAPNTKAQEIASQFLQQYLRIFDNDNRQLLLDAYNENACFSLTVTLINNNSFRCSDYVSDNRNLRKVVDPAKRRKLLKQGRLQVVSYISQLPKTRHDLSTLTMDIGLVTESMMMITVTGIFRELETRDPPIRYFTRTFIIVPQGSGYCISNEMLNIRKPTDRQEKQALEGPVIPEAPPHVAVPQTTAVPVAATSLSDDVRTQMTLAVSERTNMNLQWSLKCLEEVQWDFMRAVAAFHEINARGQIPPDAFNK